MGLWVVLAFAMSAFPSNDNHWRRAYALIAIGVPLLVWITVQHGFVVGLLGLVVYSSNARIKEISIRKIHGASLLNIMAMLNKDYIQWVLFSFLVVYPVAWTVLNRWLQNFAYQINLSGRVFVVSGLLILTTALLTINGQIFKAARKNPAETLRYE